MIRIPGNVLRLNASIRFFCFFVFQDDISGAYENFLKQFLTRPSIEMKAGYQLAQNIANAGLERKMLAQRDYLNAQQGQDPMMNHLPVLHQAPQFPQLPVYV
mgnify:CR=1 FL=1